MRRAVLGLACSVGAAALLAASSPPQVTFTSRVEGVRLDVLVTDHGRPVKGLTSADFEVFDNDVRQDVSLIDPDQVPFYLVFAFDVSASVEGARLEHLQAAARTLLGKLKAGDQVALLTCSDNVHLASPLSPDLDLVRKALDAMMPAGETSIVDAAFAGMVVGESAPGRSLEILFTDGIDTASWLEPDALVRLGRRSEVVFYPVATGSGRGLAWLRQVGEATGGRALNVESTEDLSATFVTILDEFRSRYLLGYTPTRVVPGGWHRVEVKVKGRRLDVHTRPGYQADSPR